MSNTNVEKMEKVKEFINVHEGDTLIGRIGAIKQEVDNLKAEVADITGSEKKEDDDGSHLFEWLQNDKKLLQYAELKMNEDNLKWGDKFKMELLELRLSITCSYFEEFQTFLERLKHRDDIGWNTETNSIIPPDYSGEFGQEYTDIPLEIDESDVAEIAHLGCPKWNTRKRGEKLEVNKEQRIKFLFPEGLPKSKEEMERKYLTSITVQILDEQGNTQSIKLDIHKKLAKNYEAIFKELLANGVKIDGKATGAYNRRKIRRGKKQSEHSYGTAIDINWAVNGGVYGKTDKNSIYYNNQTTVEIFKKYGFAWGGDWSSKSDDPMHFTYLGG